MENKYFHSVTLDTEHCIGCTDCIKRCPMEAIRVRNGKAEITSELCIDCGLCIRVCKHHAKKAVTDPFDMIKGYKYKIALPAPTLYAQFKNTQDANKILTCLKMLGFDAVFEVARGAEEVTRKTQELINSGKLKKPVISSACPAVTRLIALRYPSLIENLLPVISPKESAAKAARNYARSQGVADEDVGVFFISPCAAKVTNIRNPIDVEASAVNGAISLQEIFLKIRAIVKTVPQEAVEALCQSTGKGIKWPEPGGEGFELRGVNSISVDSIENVNKVLELLENGQLKDVDFIEGLACTGGCLGGPLVYENPFVAKNNLKRVEANKSKYKAEEFMHVDEYYKDINIIRTKSIAQETSVLNLDSDMKVAMEKMDCMQKIYDSLPHIDCGSCGAPTCMALAEDIVRNKAKIEDCTFMLRDKVKELARSMVDLAEKLPPSIGVKEKPYFSNDDGRELE